VLMSELCSRLWVLEGFNVGIFWERPSRSREGFRKGCRCIPLPDLLRQMSCKNISVPRLGLSVVCAAQAPRSGPCHAGGCRAVWKRVQGQPGSRGLAACSCALGCNCPAPVGLGWAVRSRWKWGDLCLLVTCQDPGYFSSHFREAQVSERWH